MASRTFLAIILCVGIAKTMSAPAASSEPVVTVEKIVDGDTVTEIRIEKVDNGDTITETRKTMTVTVNEHGSSSSSKSESQTYPKNGGSWNSNNNSFNPHDVPYYRPPPNFPFPNQNAPFNYPYTQ